MSHRLHSCNEEHCMPCSGGLALCEICGGAEASMPKDCPGRRMTADEADSVQAGKLDFVDGEFVKI